MCVLSVPSLLSHEPPAQTRAQRCFPIMEDWCPVLVSVQESLVRWARVVQQCLQSEPGGAARHSLQMNNLFSQLCNILWSHTRPPDRDTRSPARTTHTTTAPLDANPDGGPTSAFVLWWRVIQPGAPIAALGLSQITLASLTDVSSFITLCAPHVVHSGDDGSTTSSRSTTGTTELARVRSDFVSGFHHGLRPPLWLGRQAWTIPPNCRPRVCDRWRSHFSSVASSQDTHYSLDFFNLISSHFVHLTSASSSGPFDAPFSAPELA